MDMLAFTMVLRGHAGPPSIFSLLILGDQASQLKLAVAPASFTPVTGSLQTFTQAQLISPPKSRLPYAYNLDFPGPVNRVPAQHFVVQPSSVATVSENYFHDRPSAGLC